MKKSKPNPERDEGLFENLPQEITIHILSYLPIGAIITCRRVCKTWHELIGRHDFVTSHLAKSSAATCVAVVQNVEHSNLQRLCVFAEEHDAARDDSTLVSQFGHCDLHEQATSPKGLLLFKTFSMLDKNRLQLTIHGSANGFLFWNAATSKGYSLFVCNPITREYIGLNFRRRPQGVKVYNSVLGFGVSRRSGHYKIVRLFREHSRFSGLSKSVCKGEVYTLGTGLWRSVEVEMPYQYCYRANEPSDPGAFVNGNLHWLIFDRNNNARVCCFDLETELFASFSPPRGLPPRIYGQGYWLCGLDGRLCLSNNAGSDVDIWLMKEYGDESSWERELSIKKPVGGIDGFLHPLKVFKNGDILFVVTHNPAQQYWYSSKTKAIQKYGDVEKPYFFVRDRRAAAYTPSFVSLKTLATKNNVDRVRSW